MLVVAGYMYMLNPSHFLGRFGSTRKYVPALFCAGLNKSGPMKHDYKHDYFFWTGTTSTYELGQILQQLFVGSVKKVEL